MDSHLSEVQVEILRTMELEGRPLSAEELNKLLHIPTRLTRSRRIDYFIGELTGMATSRLLSPASLHTDPAKTTYVPTHIPSGVRHGK